MMKGRAVAHGAVTIVNAISTGKGAALGIDLKTEATVETTPDSKKIDVKILGGKREDPALAKAALRVVLDHFSIKSGAYVEVKSEIPIARGLKSSSTAANAIVLATVCALGKRIPDEDVVKLGVDAAFKAKVTITGAYDDACASYFGGAVLTDNFQRRILWRSEVDETLVATVYVPNTRIYTRKFPKERLNPLRYAVEMAFDLAIKGDFWGALTLNGLIHSSALSLPTRPSLDALLNGALAAGLSGTGPAIAAISKAKDAKHIASVWSSLPGRILSTKLTNSKAECA